jgi:hypothetical protein
MTKQRRSSWTPVIVSNRGSQEVRQANEAIAFISLHVTSVDGLLEDTGRSANSARRADLRFAVGVAIALAFPALISLGIYAAAEFLILKAI